MVSGDLAIRGDRIVAVGRVPADAPARRTIDASGLVVAPGFIDAHSHSDWVLFEDGDAPSKIRQGVTTEILGEDHSGGPNRGKLAPKVVTVKGRRSAWPRSATTSGPWSGRGRPSTSPATSAWGTSGASVMGDSFDRPTPAQLAEMAAILDEAMRDGALGLSTMLAAPQEMVATTDDLVALCRVVGPSRRDLRLAHPERGGRRPRGDPRGDRRRRALRGPGRDHPPEDRRQALWGRMAEVVALIDAARAAGRQRPGQRLSVHPGQQRPGEHRPALGPRGGPRRDARPAQGPAPARADEARHPRRACRAGTTTTWPSAATGRGCSSAPTSARRTTASRG